MPEAVYIRHIVAQNFHEEAVTDWGEEEEGPSAALAKC